MRGPGGRRERNIAREREVVRLREQGLTLAEVGRRLRITARSVANALRRQGRTDLLGARGFAGIEPERQREIASRGDKPGKPGEGSRPAIPESMRKVGEFAIADCRQASKVVRQHAADWGIKPDRIGIMGFSAGGMVTMGVVMDDDAESRPDFAALIYGGGTGGAGRRHRGRRRVRPVQSDPGRRPEVEGGKEEH